MTTPIAIRLSIILQINQHSAVQTRPSHWQCHLAGWSDTDNGEGLVSTGNIIEKVPCWISGSEFVWFDVPLLLSPLTENFRPSFVTHIVTDSPKLLKSRHTRANSPDGIFMMALYSVSGMPTCSLSISVSFMANSDILQTSLKLIHNMTRLKDPRNTHKILFHLKDNRYSFSIEMNPGNQSTM